MGGNPSQSEDSEWVSGSNKDYGGGGSSIRDWGAHMQILGNGNGGKIGDTEYYSRGKQVIISRAHWGLGGYIWEAGEPTMGLETLGHGIGTS